MARMLPLFGATLAGMVIGAGGMTYASAQNAPQITRTEILRKSSDTSSAVQPCTFSVVLGQRKRNLAIISNRAWRSGSLIFLNRQPAF